MVTLRATRKVLKWLSPATAGDFSADTALGDWYANRLVVDRRPLLLLVSSRSLLSIIEPGRHLRQLPERLPDLVRQRLNRLGAGDALIEQEIAAMEPIFVGSTRDRSVLGTLVDFSRIVRHFLPSDGWTEEDLRLAESRLAEMPCRVTVPGRSTLFPADVVPRLLEEAWTKLDRTKH